MGSRACTLSRHASASSALRGQAVAAAVGTAGIVASMIVGGGYKAVAAPVAPARRAAPVAKTIEARAVVKTVPAPTVVRTAPVRHAAPANPSNGQIANAAAVKAQAAIDVGRLSGLITGVDVKIQDLNDAAELSKENYLEALSKLAVATTSATKAQKAVVTAAASVTAARGRFRLSVASSYMNRTPDAGSLLTAPDPTALLERDQLYRYAQSRQSSGIDDLYRATVTKANADATARSAVSTRTTASTTANTAAEAAVVAVSAAKTQRVGLAHRKKSYQRQLQSAGERLTGLKDKRAAYRAWQQAEAQRLAIEAARLAAQRRRELAAQAREAKRQEALARQRAADEQAAQAAQAAQAEQARKDRARRQRERDAAARASAASARAVSARAVSARAVSAKARAAGARPQKSAEHSNDSSDSTSSDSTSSGSASSGSASNNFGAETKNSKAASSSKRRLSSAKSSSRSSKSRPDNADSSSSNKSGSDKSKSDDAGSGNSGSRSGSGDNSDSGRSSGGGSRSWSPARGRAAARRAQTKVGVRYSFAAGSYSGATLGVCIPGDSAWNDCHIRGYDCSGLTLYAWAGEGIYMPHYSKAQYDEGSVHPSVDSLMPGDLVFFSSNGQQSGIHHVALYIGNDRVVQAPQSGDRVKISSLWRNGYLGATRPGT